jgi:1,4-alpha-glucan branching enzyme
MARRSAPRTATSLLGDHDLHLFNEGSHLRLWERFGAHPGERAGAAGVHFAVWAPNARRVSAIGDWNGWHPERDVLAARGRSGIFEGFVPGATRGHCYKYRIESRTGHVAEKADPFAFCAEEPPRTASRIATLEYEWGDAEWMRTRRARSALDAPVSVYELHAGSWRRGGADGKGWLSYRELAEPLAEYACELGFTHVELLPVMEHPFYGSWGYQTTGYFAPTSRYGAPQDLMYLIDQLHQRGVGVILDWVPSHFPTDAHGLGYFDGTHLYEHGDPRQGFHPDWSSFIFNYGRHEVRSFLLSSALYWLDVYHADALRVDAVASMLYLDYSRRAGEWVPNPHGGRENLGAIELLRRLNVEVYGRCEGAQTVAEESTSWPLVTRPTHEGGLGFGYKWDMGWMHDTLEYLRRDPLHRKHHHDELTFRATYADTENFVLALSHDEVVHGKGSLLGRMPGDRWQQLANLRLLFALQWTTPGKKLLFMGGELAQEREWSHEGALDWALLADPAHRGVQRFVRDLNTLYRGQPALHELDCEPGGFAWVDCRDAGEGTLSWLRRGRRPEDVVLVACNLTPVPRLGRRLGVPRGGRWRELLNGDAALYGGSGLGNLGGVESERVRSHGFEQSVRLTLPPLAAVVLKPA